MKVTIKEFTEIFFTKRPEILVDNQKYDYLIKGDKKNEFINEFDENNDAHIS